MKKFAVSVIVALMLIVMIVGLSGCNKLVIGKIEFNEPNLMEGASIASESLEDKEKADAKNMLADNNKCWTPSNASKYAKVEIDLAGEKTFNTAMISEIGNEVQYFRLQAFVNGEWTTFYSSEKIEDQRIISFDSVTTSKIAMTIEKFGFKGKYAKIKSFKLFNLTSDRQNDFNTTVYQRIDIVKPSEVLAKGEEYAKTFARYYDVYNTVIIFDVVNWDAQGNLVFKNEGVDGLSGEDYFKREIKALKELVEMRTNPHKVRIILTALADGAGGGHEGVNTLMHANHTRIAEEMVNKFIKSEKDGGYDLDGLDIDWEYPQSKQDWACYDVFMKELDEKMTQVKPDAIISAALSAWALGMKPETMDIIDQIQYMAYDDIDSDGVQSTIYNAQKGIALFVKNGADKSKINIGIPSYGRPINGASYWHSWKDLHANNMYFDSRYERVNCENKNYYMDNTFCSPALAGDKTALAIFSGCGGIMVFRLTCDKLMNEQENGRNIAVANGIEDTLKRYFPNWGK